MSLSRKQLIERRRNLKIAGYKNLQDVGLDGDYISPMQIVSNSSTGPVLLAYNWLDAPSAIKYKLVLQKWGYLSKIKFNRIVNAALSELYMRRDEVYITQVFHLLPEERSQSIPREHIDLCFKEITRHELNGRIPIAMGDDAQGACKRAQIEYIPCIHPSARKADTVRRNELVQAIKQVRS